MTFDQDTLLFFDASCLMAGAGSPTGGSGFLLSLCTRRWLRGAVSQIVLLEAEYNIQAKMGEAELVRYHRLLVDTPLVMAAAPPVSPDTAWLQCVNAKDAHVLAAALAAKATYLLTLDQKLVKEINQTGLSIQALTPGDFIRTILPLHKDSPNLRE